MSRRILSALLALFFVVGVATVSKADVTGSFDLTVALQPQTTAYESVIYWIDLQANLQVNVTMSGLTFGADLGFGTTGVEFAILSVNTNLGALSVFDQFVFAPAFGCNDFNAGGGDNGNGGIVGQCPGGAVQSIGVSGADTNVIGFVKKRVEMEINIAGVTINNLALLEDVDFPDIYGINPSTGLSDHEHDHFLGTDTYDFSTSDTIIDNNIPSFGFGDVITLSGQTVSGISVTNIAGICADAQDVNRIKKRSFAGEVSKYCAGGAADINDGSVSEALLAFTVEKILVEGIEIGGISLDAELEFRPGLPVSADFTVGFSVAGLANVLVIASSDNITNLSLSFMRTTLSADNLTLLLDDFGGNLSIDRVIGIFSVVLNPNQNPASLSVQVISINGTGLVRLQPTLSVSRSGVSFSTTTRWSGGPTLEWAFTTFDLSAEVGALSFNADLTYSPAGFSGVGIGLGVVF